MKHFLQDLGCGLLFIGTVALSGIVATAIVDSLSLEQRTLIGQAVVAVVVVAVGVVLTAWLGHMIRNDGPDYPDYS